MSQKVSPGAWWVIMAILKRGVLATCGAGAPAAAGAWVGCEGAPPALHAMATAASPPAHATTNDRLADSPSPELLILRVSLSPASCGASPHHITRGWIACQYIFSSLCAGLNRHGVVNE